MDWTIGPLDLWTIFWTFFGPFPGLNLRLFFKGGVCSFFRGLVYHMFFLREEEGR